MDTELEAALDMIEALVSLSEALAGATEQLAEHLGYARGKKKPPELEAMLTSALGATNNARMFVATVRGDADL